MLRVGIPNRSSLLHVAAVVLAVEGGFIDRELYHPARLHYEGRGVTVHLMRNVGLVERVSQGELDLVFTGEDYAAERLWPEAEPGAVPAQEAQRRSGVRPRPSVYLRVPIMSNHLALMERARPRDHGPVRVYTEYPQMAQRVAAAAGIREPKVVPVAGASESFPFMDPGAVCCSVVSTGGTAEANDLRIIHRDTSAFGACWLGTSAPPLEVTDAITSHEVTASLARYYRRVLADRDAAPLCMVRQRAWRT